MRGKMILLSRIGLYLCLSLFAFSACSGINPQDQGLSVSSFDFLQTGMRYEEVVEKVGEADRDIGSGIHLMAYDLADGTEMILSFPSLDSLEAAYLYNPETGTRSPILER